MAGVRGQPIGTHFDDPRALCKGVTVESLGEPPSQKQGSKDTVKPQYSKLDWESHPTVPLGTTQEGCHEWALSGWGWGKGKEGNGHPLCTFYVLVMSFIPYLISHKDCKVGIRVPFISSEEMVV